MAIVVSKNGMMMACEIVRETPNSWFINYRDKAFPDTVRVDKKNPGRAVFKTMDKADDWLEQWND